MQDRQLYEKYGKPLEKDHAGEYVAISPDGQTILSNDLDEIIHKAVAQFGENYTLAKIGDRMMKRTEAAYVINMAATTGTAPFIPGKELNRSDKAALEVMVADAMLRSLSSKEGVSIAGIRSNPDDPPDVLFELGDQTVGMELTELLPENRLGRNAVLEGVKRNVLAQLQLSEATKDWAITITLADDYATKIRLPPPLQTVLATTLDAFFASVAQDARSLGEIPVPQKLQDHISRIIVQPRDLSHDARIGNEMEPLIVFTAQHTNVVPEIDFPELMEKVERKLEHDFTKSTWLLIWSNNYAFSGFNDQLVDHIRRYLIAHPPKYDRIFYFHYHPLREGITEF